MRSDSSPSCNSTPVLSEALNRAAAFLLRGQQPDGTWRDFYCTPGISEAWVTAYVGLRALTLMEALGPSTTCQRLSQSVERASLRLQVIASDRGGWGYNRFSAIDADSTAQVILLLCRAGRQVALRSYATLAGFQLASGLFSTFRLADPTHGWGHGHPEVTAVCLQAISLVLAPDHDMMKRGVAALATHARSANASDSYWWPSPFYLPCELLRLRAALPTSDVPIPCLTGIQSSLPFSCLGCFDQALALECLVLDSDADPTKLQGAEAVHRGLLASQQTDGSWPTQAILRIPPPSILNAAQARRSAAPLVADQGRLFTTATVVQALSVYCLAVAKRNCLRLRLTRTAADRHAPDIPAVQIVVPEAARP